MGKLGEPGKLIYSASKSTLLAGTKSIALELAKKKIRLQLYSSWNGRNGDE